MTQDQEITKRIIDEHGRAAGGALAEQTVMNMLRTLMIQFGDRYSLNGARNSLDDLIATAQQYKQDLTQA